MRTKADTLEIVRLLREEYPVSECTLDYGGAWQLLVAVRLAAQCTDARVNVITDGLFAAYPTLGRLAALPEDELERIIRPCGLSRGKARDIHAALNIVLREHGGLLPNTMEGLLRLPGVGRKSANLILGDIYRTPGVVVADTHCIRMAVRLGFVADRDPLKTETALRRVLPPEESNDFCHRCVLHGRAVCTARTAPACDVCVLAALCPKNLVTGPKNGVKPKAVKAKPGTGAAAFTFL